MRISGFKLVKSLEFFSSDKQYSLLRSSSPPTVTCMQRRAPRNVDEVVDISEMYCINLQREDIGVGHFTTCKAHRVIMEVQSLEYELLVLEEGFWPYLQNQTRRATLPLHRKIEDLVKRGIPPKHRGKMWLTMSGTQSKSQLFLPLYSDFFLQQRTQAEIDEQISNDVSRTFPALGHADFLAKLTRVLTAYSLRNPKLGYCQSMNFLAGTLLVFMKEEHAFWMLVYMVEDLLPNYFTPTMSGFHVDAQVFERLIAEYLPALSKYFHKVHVGTAILTAPWFLCLFINDLPTETAFIVWDSVMKDGVVAMFEVGLAILRVFQQDLFRYKDQPDLIEFLRRATSNLYDPTKLRKYWLPLDKKKILKMRIDIQKKVDEDAHKALLNKQFSELEMKTHFEPDELTQLWRQYTSIDPFLRYGSTGLDQGQFSRLIKGTFGDWADRELAERLFALTDVNNDGYIDFVELVMLLSVMCRGTFRQSINFNFHLFDVHSKGSIDRFDVLRMLQSVYHMFRADPSFHSLLMFFVDAVFESCNKNGDGSISIANFDHVVSIQPQIMHRFKARNAHLKYDPKKTYYYWVFDTDRPHRRTEVIHCCMDRSPAKTSFVAYEAS